MTLFSGTRGCEKKRKRVHRNFCSCSFVFFPMIFPQLMSLFLVPLYFIIVVCSTFLHLVVRYYSDAQCLMLRSFYQKPINTEKPLSTWEWRMNVRQNVYIVLWTSTIGSTQCYTATSHQPPQPIQYTMKRIEYKYVQCFHSFYIIMEFSILFNAKTLDKYYQDYICIIGSGGVYTFYTFAWYRKWKSGIRFTFLAVKFFHANPVVLVCNFMSSYIFFFSFRTRIGVSVYIVCGSLFNANWNRLNSQHSWKSLTFQVFYSFHLIFTRIWSVGRS